MLGADKLNGCRGLPSLYGCAYWVSGLRRLPALNRTPGYALARCREIPDGIRLPILTTNIVGGLPRSPRRPAPGGPYAAKPPGIPIMQAALIRPGRIFSVSYRTDACGPLELIMTYLSLYVLPPAQTLAFYFRITRR